MRINPEFLRNVWLEMTPHRLIAMPAVLGGIIFLVYLISSNTSPTIYPAFRMTGYSMYLLITVIWGSRLAAESVTGEIRDKTWDMQRMTAIPAWQMTWGKLFGSTIFSWYGALICLVVYIYGAIGAHEPFIFKQVVLLLGTGVLVQALTILASLIAIQRSRTITRSGSSAAMLVGIIIAFSVLGAITLDEHDLFLWYDEQYLKLDFVLTSVLVFCFWIILGVYRLLRQEFQYRNSSFVWLGFVCFLAFYLAGMVSDHLYSNEELLTARLFTAFLVTLVLVYFQIFMQSKDPIIIRQLLMLFKAGNWKGLALNLPAWLTTIMVSTLFGGILLFRDYPTIDLVFKGMNVQQHILTALFFVYRDIAIVIYFNIAASRKRSDTTAFIYLVILYFLIPSISSNIGLQNIAYFFNPFSPSFISMAGGLIQFIVVGVLVVRRWRLEFAVGN